MSKLHHHLQIIGRRESIDLPDLQATHVIAKIDTGAFRTAIHCISCQTIYREGKEVLQAIFDLDGKGEKTFYFEQYSLKEIKSSFGQSEKRFCVRTRLRIGGRDIRSEVSLTDRSEMKYQVLIGRKTLLKKYLVDVNQVFVTSSHHH